MLAATAGVAAAIFTCVLRLLLIRLHLFDTPDGRLKRHRQPIPTMGGLAVMGSLGMSLQLFMGLEALPPALVGGTVGMATLGLIDDVVDLSPSTKLFAQAALAWPFACQLAASWGIGAQLLALLWLVGASNAVNLLDVADGVAAGCCGIGCLGLAALSTQALQPQLHACSLALGASLLGFTAYNRPPARIYLGDTGSLAVGFCMAAVALTLCCSSPSKSSFMWLSPAGCLAVPLFELALLCVVRLGRGHSPMRGSPDHVAIVLSRRGLGAWQVAIVLWVAAAGWAGLATKNVAQGRWVHLIIWAALLGTTLIWLRCCLWAVDDHKKAAMVNH